MSWGQSNLAVNQTPQSGRSWLAISGVGAIILGVGIFVLFGPDGQGSAASAQDGNRGTVLGSIYDFLGIGDPGTSANRSSELRSVRQLEELTTQAAGYNGIPYYQFHLGRIYEDGQYVVRQNLVEALVWYNLAAAQGYQPADYRRRELSNMPLPGQSARDYQADALPQDDIIAAYARVIEIYLDGGPEAQYRLGELFMDPDFFPAVVERDSLPNDVRAYAAFLVARYGGNGAADRRLRELRTGVPGFIIPLTDRMIGHAEALAADWNRYAYGDTNTFEPTPFQTSQALTRGSTFQENRATLAETPDQSRAWLNAGQAHLTNGDIAAARIAFQNSIVAGPTTQAALEAQWALQGLTVTCSAERRQNFVFQDVGYADPLSRVGHIDVNVIQRALRALGLYQGHVDGVMGPNTRNAVARFQSDLNVDADGRIKSREVVELICQAAQMVRDAESQNALGIMYVNGIGVSRDLRAAHFWLEEAASQESAAAHFNLGCLYSAGVGLEGDVDVNVDGATSVRRDDEEYVNLRPEARETIARDHFAEAYRLGHPRASCPSNS